MTSSTSSSATASRLPTFESRMQDVRISKSCINALVMDYLVNEGYPEAAQNFAVEANIQPTADVESIQQRVGIRNLIYSGDIQSAIEKINEVNPQILDRDQSLHFALLRLQLVELIRACSKPNGDITPAIDFATNHLAPRAPTNPEFLKDFEQTMCLLIFPPDKLPASLAPILDPSLRKEVAQRVNEAVLTSHGEKTKSKLLELVKTRVWAENKAKETKKDLPMWLSLGLDIGLDGPEDGRFSREDSIMHGNGDNEALTS